METIKISQEELNVILYKHKKWLNDEENGERAILVFVDCSGLDFSYNDLSFISLNSCNLKGANLSNCNLTKANLFKANLIGADLTNTILKNAILEYTNLTNVKGSITTKDYMKKNFKFDKERNGYIVYKTFGSIYDPPKKWIIKENSIIEEDCNIDRRYDCGRGINCGNLDWIRNFNNKHKNLSIWKLLIKKEWLNGIIVPYITDGKIRCNKAQLLYIIE